MAKNLPDRCGGCTLCCTLLQIDSLEKPAGVQCKHCIKGKGCSIWKSHPPDCKNFVCLWYPNPRLPDELRPDRCGVLFEPGGHKVILANVDLQRPTVWREGIAWKFVQKCLADGYAVIVQAGTEKHFVLPEGVSLPTVWQRVLTDAKRRGFVV